MTSLEPSEEKAIGKTSSGRPKVNGLQGFVCSILRTMISGL